MNRTLKFRIHGAKRASIAVSLFAVSALPLLGIAAPASASLYQLTDLTTNNNSNLTSLGLPAAANVDPNLINPWGISFGPATPFWASDNGTGVSTLYSAAGVRRGGPSW